MKRSHKYVKRFFDVFFSLLGLSLFFPFMGIISALIKLDSKGPVFFRQKRLGLNGRTFKIFKFRTMYEGAKLIIKDDGSAVTYEDDPRITKIGKILRKYSIDEIPQLFNVFLGEMSLVGPRPELPIHYKLYNEEERERLKVLPGMTGLAQIEGRNSLSWSERKKLDVYYVRSQSLKLDFKILLKTIPRVIKGVGVFK